jgi:general stress protein 26
MDSELLARIVAVVRADDVICLATTDGLSPRVRYMATRAVDDDLTVTCATGADDTKTAHIRSNAHVHYIAGHPPAEPGMPTVSIDAIASIHTDKATRAEYWEDSYTTYFSGPEDDKYVILKLHPTRAWISTGEEIVDFPKVQGG